MEIRRVLFARISCMILGELYCRYDDPWPGPAELPVVSRVGGRSTDLSLVARGQQSAAPGCAARIVSQTGYSIKGRVSGRQALFRSGLLDRLHVW